MVQKFLKMKRIVIEISFGEVGEEEVILTQNLYLKEEGEKEKHEKDDDDLQKLIYRLKNNKGFINYLNSSEETKKFVDVLKKGDSSYSYLNKILEIYFFKKYFKQLSFKLSVKDSQYP